MADTALRLGASAFVLTGVAAGPLLPQPPAPDASGATIARYFVDHHDAIVAASCLSVVGALGFLVFAVALSRRTSPLVAAAGTAVGVVSLLGGLLQAGLAQVAGRLGDAVMVGAFTIERVVFYDAPALGVAVLLVAAAARLPQWLAALGLLIASVGVVSGIGDVALRGGLLGPLGFFGFLGTLGWAALTAWTLERQPAGLPASSAMATA